MSKLTGRTDRPKKSKTVKAKIKPPVPSKPVKRRPLKPMTNSRTGALGASNNAY